MHSNAEQTCRSDFYHFFSRSFWDLLHAQVCMHHCQNAVNALEKKVQLELLDGVACCLHRRMMMPTFQGNEHNTALSKDRARVPNNIQNDACMYQMQHLTRPQRRTTHFHTKPCTTIVKDASLLATQAAISASKASSSSSSAVFCLGRGAGRPAGTAGILSVAAAAGCARAGTLLTGTGAGSRS